MSIPRVGKPDAVSRKPDPGPVRVVSIDDAETATVGPSKLLHRARSSIRASHYGRRAERACINWIERFIRFQGRDRVTFLPASVKMDLQRHLTRDADHLFPD